MTTTSLTDWTSPRPNAAPARLALGTMNFGQRTSEADARRIIATAEEHGITLLDTANVYNEGESERVVGRAIAKRRQTFVVATKVGLARLGKDVEGLGKARIVAACDESLQRLGTDYIDIYYLHAPDNRTPLSDTLEGVATLLKAGKIRSWAVSNYASWQILEMFHLCEQSGLVRPVMSQVIYNLLIRQLEQEYFKFTAKYRLHSTVYNPLAGGLLSGKYKPGARWEAGGRFDANTMYQRRYWSERLLEVVETYRKIAEPLDLVTLAYAWVAGRPGVDSILIGPGSVEHLTAAVRGCKEVLSPDLRKRIDEVHYAYLGSDATYAR
jgi:aryl-alcohol dehydrogenase-like predicted oxidoreductase